MNTYITYHGVAFNTEHFIEMTREKREEFYFYCEIVITENGLIYLASPSHWEMEKYLTKKGFKNICMVCYDYISPNSWTPSQIHVLEALEAEGLIKKGIVEFYRRKYDEKQENHAGYSSCWEI